MNSISNIPAMKLTKLVFITLLFILATSYFAKSQELWIGTGIGFIMEFQEGEDIGGNKEYLPITLNYVKQFKPNMSWSVGAHFERIDEYMFKYSVLEFPIMIGFNPSGAKFFQFATGISPGFNFGVTSVEVTRNSGDLFDPVFITETITPEMNSPYLAIPILLTANYGKFRAGIGSAVQLGDFSPGGLENEGYGDPVTRVRFNLVVAFRII